MFTRPKALARTAQVLLAVAAVLVAWMQHVETRLDPRYAPISFYARSRHGWLLLVALLITATATLAGSRAYWLLRPQNKGSQPLVWLSMAIALVGLLRAQDHFPWEGTKTIEGLIHFLIGAVGFLLFAYASFVISRELKRRTLQVLSWAFLVMSIFSATHAGVLLLIGDKPRSVGLEERLILLVAVAWFYFLFPFFGPHKTSLVSGGHQA